MQYQVKADNIKCGGCANRIVSQLSELAGVESVTVDHEQGIVSWSASEDLVGAVCEKLAALGYPESGSIEGIAAVGAKAKSFVSCAIGKASDKK